MIKEYLNCDLENIDTNMYLDKSVKIKYRTNCFISGKLLFCGNRKEIRIDSEPLHKEFRILKNKVKLLTIYE